MQVALLNRTMVLVQASEIAVLVLGTFAIFGRPLVNA